MGKPGERIGDESNEGQEQVAQSSSDVLTTGAPNHGFVSNTLDPSEDPSLLSFYNSKTGYPQNQTCPRPNFQTSELSLSSFHAWIRKSRAFNPRKFARVKPDLSFSILKTGCALRAHSPERPMSPRRRRGGGRHRPPGPRARWPERTERAGAVGGLGGLQRAAAAGGDRA